MAEWITIISNETETTDRLRVESGWIYRSRVWSMETGDWSLMSMVFVPR